MLAGEGVVCDVLLFSNAAVASSAEVEGEGNHNLREAIAAVVA